MPGDKKKHPCPDCSFCQWCSDTRCDSCRGTCSKGPTLTPQEQIEVYERINKKQPPPSDEE